MLAADGIDLDLFLAEGADTLMGRPDGCDLRMAMLAADRVGPYVLFAVRTLACLRLLVGHDAS
jgi:hypothetical protein